MLRLVPEIRGSKRTRRIGQSKSTCHCNAIRGRRTPPVGVHGWDKISGNDHVDRCFAPPPPAPPHVNVEHTSDDHRLLTAGYINIEIRGLQGEFDLIGLTRFPIICPRDGLRSSVSFVFWPKQTFTISHVYPCGRCSPRQTGIEHALTSFFTLVARASEETHHGDARLPLLPSPLT